MIKEVAKHYVKRGGNFLREIGEAPATLVCTDYEIKFPFIRLFYDYRGTSHQISLEWCEVERSDFEKLGENEWEIFLSNMAVLYSPAFFNLGPIDGVYCSFAGFTETACRFFEDYLQGSLGEYRFLNGLNPSQRTWVAGNSTQVKGTLPHVKMEDTVLVLNGGGKDTVVMTELVAGLGLPQAWLTNDRNKVRENVINRSGRPESYHVNFDIQYGFRGRYSARGPIPYGALPMIQALILSYMRGFRYQVVGNEYSANFGNIRFQGMDINHQYRKTYEFEVKFSRHIQENISEQFHLFSLLRPLYELRIARIFSGFPKYFDVFVSCNREIKNARWCGECAKCAFIYLCLFPFVKREDLVGIFGSDLILNPDIRKHIVVLASGGVKPWECVGVSEECQLALALALEKDPEMEFTEYPFRADLEKACEGADLQKAEQDILQSFMEPNNIPRNIVPRLRELIERLG
ncbi:hypothetical protein [Emcibacter sp.]|uniref:hypothetical protein n=1 Tax=Emcibacter sp. TaxID=1979954 RepID=UPI002AA6C1A1|nr:hypothetical protein [Emcibacter sp.]